jgi:hypothetical protein
MTGTILRLASVFFILLVGVLSLTTASKNPSNLLAGSAASAPASVPVTWEYRTLDAPTPQLLADQANKLSSESWEVVSVVQDVADSHHHWVAILKRPKR